jgi:hypothetical protein
LFGISCILNENYFIRTHKAKSIISTGMLAAGGLVPQKLKRGDLADFLKKKRAKEERTIFGIW